MSSNLEILVVLPARLGAKRLPRKPLRILGELPIIAHAYNGVCKSFKDIVVATDSDEIAMACSTLDIPCVMTSEHHENGTARCLEAYQTLGRTYDYIVNVQGDEAFINDSVLAPLKKLLIEKRPEAATLKAPLPKYHSNSNVFVTTGANDQALYFSRSPIPASRDGVPVRFQHVGVYAFTPAALKTYCKLPPTALEDMEKLEQLRWVEHGYDWIVATSPEKPLSIDTPADYERAKSFLKAL